ncbi:MAG: putative Ig domain-containing protein, partial [Pseudomonadales bacterium]|nr:putative Ig domain-containing protein [Pseudomonadales bacterium]
TNLAIVLKSGQNILIEDYTKGQLGLTFEAAAEIESPTTTTTIVGDFEWLDFDGAEDGIQTQQDSLGNTIQDFETPKEMADELNGSEGDDHILPGADDDIVKAKAGDDIVEGGTGLDRIDGGDGNDYLAGDEGNDILQGGQGDDTLFADSIQSIEDAMAESEGLSTRGSLLAGGDDDDNLIGGTGQDTLFGGEGKDLLIGSAGDDNLMGDVIAGHALDDWVVAREVTVEGTQTLYEIVPDFYARDAEPGDEVEPGDHDDILLGGAGEDWLFGGLGDDYLDGGADSDVLFGGVGGDTLIGGTGDDLLHGDSDPDPEELDGSDRLYGGEGDDKLWGRGGNDYLYGELGNDELDGGAGNDYLSGGKGNDLLQGDDETAAASQHGDDQIYGGEGDDELGGFGGNDTLNGGAGVDTLFGGDGDDHLYGGQGADILLGENGTDFLHGGTESDDLRGGDGHDYLEGNSGDDRLLGQEGNDRLFGNSGEDYLNGGEGDDFIDSGIGTDQLVGGAGADIFAFQPGDGVDLIVDADGGDTLKIEGVARKDIIVSSMITQDGEKRLVLAYGAGDEVQIIGDGSGIQEYQFGNEETFSVSELLVDGLTHTGSDGDDTINAGSGGDILVAGLGDDQLSGGDGDDELQGGDGNDTYLINQNGGRDVIYDTGGIDSIVFGEGITVENVTLTQSGEHLLLDFDGTSDRVSIVDWFKSANAIETMHFDDGRVFDVAAIMAVVSGTHEQVIIGTSGADNLEGGSGNDLLVGDFGDDRYTFKLGGGHDQIDESVRGSIGVTSGWVNTGDDTLVLGVGILPGQLTAERINNAGEPMDMAAPLGEGSLVVHINDDDSVTIRNWFVGVVWLGSVRLFPPKIEHFEFADGTVWDPLQIDQWMNGDAINLSPTVTGDVGDTSAATGEFFQYVIPADMFVDPEGDTLSFTVRQSNGSPLPSWLIFDAPTRTLNGIAQVSDSELLEITITATDGSGLSSSNSFKLAAGNTGLPIQDEDGIVFFGGEGVDLINGSAGGDSLYGNGGDDRLDGGEGDDYLDGGQGNDSLLGRAGDDILRGGPGDDTLYGGSGSDIYLFAPGDGSARISAYDPVVEDKDTLEFLTGISPDDVEVTRMGTSLQVMLQPSDEMVTISNFFEVDKLPVSRITFADGTEWDTELFRHLVQIPTELADIIHGSVLDDAINGIGGSDHLYGRAGDDHIYGGFGSDNVYGEAGNDHLYGGEGDDILRGGDGNDFLEGGSSRDQLYGGAGNDILNGGGSGHSSVEMGSSEFSWIPGPSEWAPWSVSHLEGGLGDDVYLHSFSDDDQLLNRVTTINNFDEGPDHHDVLRFSEDINPAMVSVVKGRLYRSSNESDDDLGIIITDSEKISYISVYHFFGGSEYQLSIEFSDGTVWGAGYLEGLVSGNQEPTVLNSLADIAVSEGSQFIHTLPTDAFVDQDEGDVLTLTASLSDGSELPDWLSFDEAAQSFAGTPNNDEVGILDINVTATDQDGLFVTDTFTLTVNNINDAPELLSAIADQQVDEDSALNFVVPANTFNDIDNGDSLSFSAKLTDGSELPTWLSFDGTTQSFSGTPNNGEVGILDIDVTATDQDGLSITDTFSLTVNNTNDAPIAVGTVDGKMLLAGDDFAFALPTELFSDSDIGDTLSYSLIMADGASLPTWLDFDPETQLLSGEVPSLTTGLDSLLLVASDQDGLTATIPFNLTYSKPESSASVSSFYLFGNGLQWGSSQSETLFGQSGNDNLFGLSGDDTLNGLSGDDRLFAGSGNDLIKGGAGSDRLYGGSGDDTYQFNKGSGRDTVFDSAGNDSLAFGAGVDKEDLWFSRSGDDLLVSTIGESDQVTVSNWYSDTQNQIEQITTSVGDILYNTQVDQLVQAMASFSAPAAGETTLSGDLEDNLLPVIAASWQ